METRRPPGTEFDRPGHPRERGFPNFAFRLRDLERRLRALEARDNDRPQAENTARQENDRGRTDRR